MINTVEKFKEKKNRIAVISGEGNLPNQIIKELILNNIDPIAFFPKNFNLSLPNNVKKIAFDLYNLENLIYALKSRAVKYLIFAGKITRYNDFDTSNNLKSIDLMKDYKIDLQNTDDKLLRSVGYFFEKQGFEILSIQKILPNIFLEKGIPSNRKPSIQDRKDIEKAINIHNLMSKADIGQSLVVVNGLCIGLETLPGTDAMIEFVKNFKRKNNFFKKLSGGILFKCLKNNQDIRFDFPVIGENTLLNIKRAELNGLALVENKLITLNKDKLIKIANKLDLFISID